MMQLELPRNRVVLLSILAEQSANRMGAGLVKDSFLDISQELAELIKAHDRKTAEGKQG